ncbi:hypothetical protein AB0G95_21835 [Streptomyces virginiae]|uniref:hypothetical protein n=1 Tax=Streptomyces virginiae TaxID=1961 RepID=UPI00342DB18F
MTGQDVLALLVDRVDLAVVEVAERSADAAAPFCVDDVVDQVLTGLAADQPGVLALVPRDLIHRLAVDVLDALAAPPAAT